jgi:hypothetical protein
MEKFTTSSVSDSKYACRRILIPSWKASEGYVERGHESYEVVHAGRVLLRPAYGSLGGETKLMAESLRFSADFRVT